MRDKYLIEIFIDSQKKLTSKDLDKIERIIGKHIGFCFDLIDNPDKRHIVIICNYLSDSASDMEKIHQALSQELEKEFWFKGISFKTRWTIVEALPAKTFSNQKELVK
ncbi:MAG TPA: hypothetical protein EYP30_09440 [Archaeoglobaceae archaeon]|nr:hypothetical protein [Archaeoglobaceae archaeon]